MVKKIVLYIVCIVILLISISRIYSNYRAHKFLSLMDEFNTCNNVKITYFNNNKVMIINDLKTLNELKNKFSFDMCYSKKHNKNIKKCISSLYCTLEYKSNNNKPIKINIYLCNNNTSNYKETYYTIVDNKKCIIEINNYYLKYKENTNLYTNFKEYNN